MRLKRVMVALALVPNLAFAAAPGCPETYTDVPGYGERMAMPPGEARALLRREGAILSLAGDRGVIDMEDDPSCSVPEWPDTDARSPDCMDHEFIDAFADPRGYLVRRWYYEDYDYLWINPANGVTIVLGEAPRLSPRGDWLVTAGAAECCGITFFGVEVWRMGDVPEQVWLWPPVGETIDPYRFYLFLQWIGPETAVLCEGGTSDPFRPVLLRHGSQGWGIEPVAPAR